MNEQQVKVVLILVGLSITIMIIFFSMFFSLETPPIQKKSKNIFKINQSDFPKKKLKVSLPKMDKPQKKTNFAQKILFYQKSNQLSELVSLIQTPSKLASSEDFTEEARIRAFAMRKLLEIGSSDSLKAYLQFLSPVENPDVTLTALSSLNKKLTNPEIKQTIRKLIRFTPYNPVRAKASMVFRRVQ